MGEGGGGVGKIVKYGGMSNDRSSDKRSHKVRFEQALFEQIGPQLLYGLPVLKPPKNLLLPGISARFPAINHVLTEVSSSIMSLEIGSSGLDY